MVELLGIAAVVMMMLLVAGGVVREVIHDGYGRRPVRLGALDPSREWSTDLPSRPYREM